MKNIDKKGFIESYFKNEVNVLREDVVFRDDIGETRSVVFSKHGRVGRINVNVEFGDWSLESISIDDEDEFEEVEAKTITEVIYVPVDKS